MIMIMMIIIGGHHLDLFFSTPDDPPSVLEVRKKELAHIERWAAEAPRAGLAFAKPCDFTRHVFNSIYFVCFYLVWLPFDIDFMFCVSDPFLLP